MNFSPLLANFRGLPWWAVRTDRRDQTARLYFALPHPVRLVTVDARETPCSTVYRRSNDLFRRLMDCRETGEIICGLTWQGSRVGFFGLYLLNLAIHRGMVKRFKCQHPGLALTKYGFRDLLAWLEIRPTLSQSRAHAQATANHYV